MPTTDQDRPLATRDRSKLLRAALGSNALFTLGCGAPLAFAPGASAAWLGTTHSGAVAAFGAFLLGFALVLGATALRRVYAPWGALLAALDLGYVVGSLAFLALAPDALGSHGRAAVAIVAGIVFVLVLVELAGLRRLVSWNPALRDDGTPCHVAITGASSGIGEAFARELGRAGAKLTLVARRRELLERLAGEIGGACHIEARDLSDPARCADWIGPAEEALGPIDVLINNAGIENLGPGAEADLDQVSRLLHTNLHAPLILCRKVVPGMIARGRGTIVNVASIAGFAAAPLLSWYGASKAGLAMFSEVLRGELAPTGVHVLTVYPGPVTTPMAESAYAAVGGRGGLAGLFPEGKPDVQARLLLQSLRWGRPRLVYPRFYVLERWLPWFARWVQDLAAPAMLLKNASVRRTVPAAARG